MKSSFKRFPSRRRRVYKSHLGITHPELAKEFDSEKNEGVKIENITHGTERLVWWKCELCGESWRHSVFRRTIGQGGCPVCKRNKIDKGKTLAYHRPDLIKEWDTEMNGEFTPYNVSVKSGRSIHWVCSTCSNKWKAKVSSRTGGSGCPQCVRKKHHEFLRAQQLIVRPNNLQEIAPELVTCFDVEKNHPVKLEHLTWGSCRMIHWTCPCCNESILVKVSLFVRGRKYRICGKCGGELYKETQAKAV